MARPRKYAQRRARGCRICGDPSIGRGIEKHVRGAHGVRYHDYQTCFTDNGKPIIDKLIDTGSTTHPGGQRVVLHVLVKRFTIPTA